MIENSSCKISSKAVENLLRNSAKKHAIQVNLAAGVDSFVVW